MTRCAYKMDTSHHTPAEGYPAGGPAASTEAEAQSQGGESSPRVCAGGILVSSLTRETVDRRRPRTDLRLQSTHRPSLGVELSTIDKPRPLPR